VDEDQGLSPHSEENVTHARECRTCTIARRLARHDPQRKSAEDAFVLNEPELDGLVVLPYEHVGGLDELSDRSRARVLAALRRATRSVLEKNPGTTTTTIIVMTDPPASEGHTCFHVLPRDRGEPEGHPPLSP
jgi:diadenosine tetraphosphate (Ap4A) HIT family hydrolase